MATLTPKELRIYEFIKNYRDKKGYSPTLEEIKTKFSYKAISSVQQFIEQLTEKGFLKSSFKNQVRGLEIMDEEGPSMLSIPLEGYVAAGHLTEAVNARELIEIPQSFVKTKADYFALKIRGDSMIEDGILDGDVVIIKKQHSAENGQTVVAMVDQEATIKRYVKKAKHVELHPANPNYNVIHVDPQAEFSILGVLASLIRKME